MTSKSEIDTAIPRATTCRPTLAAAMLEATALSHATISRQGVNPTLLNDF